MSTADIENMTFAELKAERDAVIEQAKGEKVPVLAARYIKALTDAKHRDEVMGEQGRTITALQDGLEATKVAAETARETAIEQAEHAEAEIAKWQNIAEGHMEAVSKAEKAIVALTSQLQAETERANRIKAEASRNYAALSGAAQLVNDALSKHAIENADSGE